ARRLNFVAALGAASAIRPLKGIRPLVPSKVTGVMSVMSSELLSLLFVLCAPAGAGLRPWPVSCTYRAFIGGASSAINHGYDLSIRADPQRIHKSAHRRISCNLLRGALD